MNQKFKSIRIQKINREICMLFLVVGLILSSCERNKILQKWQHIVISPLDNSQEVTVITKGQKRYFINGSHNEIPKGNYLLVDLSEVDHLGDGFSVCWNDPAGYKWKIASSYAKLIENKLDTSKYLYYNPMEKEDLPISIEYKEDNCGNMLIRENRKPWGNLNMKYIKKE